MRFQIKKKRIRISIHKKIEPRKVMIRQKVNINKVYLINKV